MRKDLFYSKVEGREGGGREKREREGRERREVGRNAMNFAKFSKYTEKVAELFANQIRNDITELGSDNNYKDISLAGKWALSFRSR